MVAKIAVAAATFAIDKPYSYRIPADMELQPGMRSPLAGVTAALKAWCCRWKPAAKRI